MAITVAVVVGGCSSSKPGATDTDASDASSNDDTDKGSGDNDDVGDNAPTVDTTPPDLTSVSALTNVTVRVVFSEAIAAATVVASNFHIQGVTDTVAVQKAELDIDGRSVSLTVAAGMQHGATYTLLVQGVSDTAGNVIANATKGFVGLGAVAAELSGAPAALTNVAAVSVTVSGTDIVAYQYALTGPSQTATWSAEIAIATAITSSDLSDGAYTLRVVGKNAAGAWQGYDEPTSAQWVLDTVAPTAKLATTPPSITSAPYATLTVTGEGVVAYTYALDGSAQSTEASIETAIEATGLGEGPHIVAVVGRDQAGNWQAASNATVFTWTIDLTAPVATLSGSPADPTNVTRLDITVGGADVASYIYSLDGGEWSTLANTDVPISATDLAEGTHTLSVAGSDLANNPQQNPTELTWTVDTTPPVVTLSGLPASPTNATTTHILVSGADVVSYRYSLDGGALGGVYLVGAAIDLTGLMDGEHTIAVIGADAAGNWQTTSASHAWTIDTTTPIAVLSAVAPLTNHTDLSVTVSGTDVVSYKYERDAGDWSAEISIADAITDSGLLEGPHTLSVIGRDSAGNWQSIASATSVSWTIDTTPPSATMNGLPALLTSGTALEVSVGGCVAYMMSLDGGTWSASTDVSEHITASGLAEGGHALDVVGTDAAGNWQVIPTSYAWTIDTTAPSGVVLSSLPSDPSNDPAPQIIVSGTDVVAYAYAVDGGTWSGLVPVTTPITLSVGEGGHTVAVRGVDSAGNVQDAPTNVTWTVDLTAPTVALSNLPASLTNVDSATVTVSGADFYSVQLDGGATSATTPITTPIVLASLGDGTHTLDVYGRDVAGNWQATPTTATWTVDHSPPTPPTVNDLSGSVGGLGTYSNDLSLTFAWTNPSDAVEVAIQVATDAAFTNIVFGGTNGASVATAQSYDYIVSPTNGAVYYARLRVRDVAQNWSAFGAASDGIHVVGGVSGKVKNSNLAVVNGATVALQLTNGTAVTSVASDASGNFTIANVDIGTSAYKLAVSATGYTNATKSNVTVTVGATSDIGVIYLVSSSASPGTIAGSVVDANAGAAIKGATVTVIDWTGATVTTATTSSVASTAGTFTTASVAPGTYSLLISMTNFFSLQVDNVSVDGNKTVGQQALCQVLAEPQVRVVVLWGQNPQDLDLHVVGPTAKTVTVDGTPNNRFHVYWQNRKSFNENSGAYATAGDPGGTSSTTSLVQDDQHSYGPEAINLFGLGGGYAHGIYTFTVHDYSASDWYAAPITLRIYDSQGMVQEIPIPNNAGSQYYWRVFKMDIQGATRGQRSITINNTFDALTYSSKSSMDW